MTELDDKLQPKTLELIERLGTTAQLTKKFHAYTNAGGTNTGSTQTYTLKVGPFQGIGEAFRDSTALLEADLVFYTPGLDAEATCEPGDTISGSGVTGTVVRVDPLRSGERISAFRVFIKGKG
ncbi:hypothetical protein [Engelhardtia mirabilis]|uniref:Uncharacterized protein n=1 Tax=Engelhardtia mirabilis TaxID=2528011 RepID=A0A518BL71_9BACT|nr:hypothetical protein Pla133_27960 [Planctomycetes bacterium Pla133]QDV02034.1 hypothetical protein Pla86_27950 [Planctomycetes bacterium Pla86]